MIYNKHINKKTIYYTNRKEITIMREKLKNEILVELDKCLDINTLKQVEVKLDMILSNYEVDKRKTEIIEYGSEVPESVKTYIVIKKISGMSDKTLYLYHIVLKNFFETVRKRPENVGTNDIRVYLYNYQKEHNISNRTLDSRRTIICGYFNWMASEEYISKNPTINISPIKYERKHKKAMSQLDLEKVRIACETKREKAIVEVLYSTGCRVTELERLNISDVNFETKEIILFGKGNKHRISYLNAKAEVALMEYLNERKDNNQALFVTERKPHNRLRKSGIELIVRNLMERTDGVSTHVTPHIFRHTTATIALNRGMNIVEVSKLLGHNRIETTMEYITTDSSSVKIGHLSCVV